MINDFIVFRAITIPASIEGIRFINLHISSKSSLITGSNKSGYFGLQKPNSNKEENHQ